MNLKITSADPGWNTGNVQFTFGNAEVAAEGEAPPEMLHVAVMFALADAGKAEAKARARTVLQAALAALD